MKKSRKTFVVYAACAILWTIITIISIVKKSCEHSLLLFMMNALCAVLWYIVFFVELKRNRSSTS